MKGSTLIETLVYIALLAILMVGVLSSVYVLLHGESHVDAQKSDNELLLKNIQ